MDSWLHWQLNGGVPQCEYLSVFCFSVPEVEMVVQQLNYGAGNSDDRIKNSL